MDEWPQKLVRELVAETPSGKVSDSAAVLESAFGEARSAILYVLELARAHRIAATGTATGDDIWVQLGAGRVRFTLNRREGHVVVSRPDRPEAQVPAASATLPNLRELAREAIDALVARWRALPLDARRPSAPPPEFEDEPTKG